MPDKKKESRLNDSPVTGLAEGRLLQRNFEERLTNRTMPVCLFASAVHFTQTGGKISYE